MPPSPPRQQLTIRDAMVLIAGTAYSLWLFTKDFKGLPSLDVAEWFFLFGLFPGGLSLACVPLLLITGLRHRRRWRSGAQAWFAMGLACWGLAPALTIARIRHVDMMFPPGTAALVCAIMLPVMGLFLLAACLIAGRPVRGWWKCRGWWPEWLGMWVLLGWAVVGAYILFVAYADVFR